MPFRYQPRPEVIAEYPVDPIDVIGECGACVAGWGDGYRAASPGGVTATGRVGPPQLQTPDSTGTWQESHQ